MGIENREFSSEEIGELRQTRERDAALSDYVFEGYRIHLNLELEDLSNKKILDVGSGAEEDFSRVAKQYGADVYSINPKLAAESARSRIIALPDWQRKSVAARVQELPFKNEEFDLILSHWAVSVHLPKVDKNEIGSELLLAYSEMCRVLRPGGQIRIFPFRDRNESEEMTEEEFLKDKLGAKLLEWFADNNIAVRLKTCDVPTEGYYLEIEKLVSEDK